mmetsp:Transcript_710/g.1116  ORF Transcript_710/g.1116 Transcript_710/m.1116 type:complete len:224 (+) Transcript_710:303-974(+)
MNTTEDNANYLQDSIDDAIIELLCVVKSQRELKPIFRKHQGEKWNSYFEELLALHTEYQRFPTSELSKSTKLAGWIKRQRCHYKRFQSGRESAMTPERIEKLESIGFVWDKQEALWQQRAAELLSFKKASGHCCVPRDYQEYPKLANWVKCQKRQYKLYQQGLVPNFSKERIRQLDAIGFQWNAQKSFDDANLVNQASYSLKVTSYFEAKGSPLEDHLFAVMD